VAKESPIGEYNLEIRVYRDAARACESFVYDDGQKFSRQCNPGGKRKREKGSVMIQPLSIPWVKNSCRIGKNSGSGVVESGGPGDILRNLGGQRDLEQRMPE